MRTADTLVGRVLDGRYRVGPKIARGGMATVYEATDLRLERAVAVKVMHEGLADDDEFVRRFQREARSAARLSHPHVVSVFDTGDDAGTLFLVMELVPGLTLRDLIRKDAPLPPGRALALLEPVLSALAAAHDAGLVHRDIKPENVLLADDGRIKVADFGLSRAINSETQHTATGGVLIGSVSYLSPELVLGHDADARSDVYAAGVLLHELLTGHKPHHADSPIQVAYKHVHEDVPAPSRSTPGIPAYVDAVVARATARDAALRPADARVLLHQVRRVRLALDQGVADDPDLVADLTPTVPVGGMRAPTGELPSVVVEPEDALDDGLLGEDPGHGVPLQRGGAWDTLGGSVGGRDDVYDHAGDWDTTASPRLVGRLDRDAGRLAPATGPSPSPALSRRDRRDRRRQGRERRSRRGPLLLALVLVLAVVAALAGWYLGVARYTTAPGLLGKTEAAARATLAEAGLEMRVSDRAWSETVARGRVASTDPGPGDRVLKEGTVAVVLSLGPERHDVPAVAGRTLDDAQQLLDDARLAYGDAVQRYDEKVPAGSVVTSDPAPGTSLRRGTAVDLVVSRGPRPVRVPDLTGKPADTARQRLEKLGFEVETTSENSDSVPKDRVISQSPRTGTAVKGDTVALVVSEGPVLVEVPDVVRMGTEAARATLERAGFQVREQRSGVYIGLQYVVGQEPRGGKAPKGSTITISVV